MATPSSSDIGRVLGVEGTAWAASAAVYDVDSDTLAVTSDPYEPESGGIHPREAAEHMRAAIPRVVAATLEDARTGTADAIGPPDDPDRSLPPPGRDVAGSADVPPGDVSQAGAVAADVPPIDAVAVARGPGLGPCLRIANTAARALAGRLDVPLVGVNHMVAHAEIGRHRAGFADPVCLNASGANAHVLAARGGRYRVLGETMDTGIGNAIDKFARHLDWTHPGGPKVESAARDGDYHELPYVVKGMDFSFAGLTSAAQDAVDRGVAVPDVCAGLQETAFGMLTEVAERALSLTGRDELVLGGGVGQNERLREMLGEMCAARDADVFAPTPALLRDNAGMIAVLGAQMARAGDTIAIADSRVDPDFRPDEVPISWRAADGATGARSGRSGAGGSAATADAAPESAPVRGAEATVTVAGEAIVKRRAAKTYRAAPLDRRLRRDRLIGEARLLSLARRRGVPTPVLSDVDLAAGELTMQRVGSADLRDALAPARVAAVAHHLAVLHDAGVVHGDPTVRNVRVAPDESPVVDAATPVVDTATPGDDAPDAGRCYLIDFGLGYHSEDVEDFAMDLHVLEQSVAGTAADPEPAIAAARERYAEVGDTAVLDRLAAIADRGRYR